MGAEWGAIMKLKLPRLGLPPRDHTLMLRYKQAQEVWCRVYSRMAVEVECLIWTPSLAAARGALLGTTLRFLLRDGTEVRRDFTVVDATPAGSLGL